MSIMKVKQNHDFYSLLGSMSIDELEKFIGQPEDTGLAQALSLDYCYKLLESEEDLVDFELPSIFIQSIQKAMEYTWNQSKLLNSEMTYGNELPLLCINDELYAIAA